MSRRFSSKGEERQVSARQTSSDSETYAVMLGETALKVSGTCDDGGEVSFMDERGRRRVAVVSALGDERWVTIDGHTHHFLAVRDARAGAPQSAGNLEAPMPGRVLDVRVREGDVVQAGDVLLVVEAMKMEHAIKAPKAGVVASIAARVDEMVTAGTPLVQLDDVEGEAPA